MAGGLYAGFVRFLGPGLAGVENTFDMTMYMLVGGIGTLLGPLLGALMVPWLTQYLQFLQEYRFIVFGPILVVLVIFVPRRHRGSYMGWRAAPRMRWPQRRKPATAAAEPPNASRRPAMLEVRNLTKRFGGLSAVNEVSDHHRARQDQRRSSAPTAPARPPSSTWSAARIPPTSGSITFDGHDITALRADQVARLGISRTFQTTALFDMATVLDNLIVGHRLRTEVGPVRRAGQFAAGCAAKSSCAASKAREALDFVGLSHIAHRMAGDISQEERKRVAFALALSTEPELLLLDEPAGGVNPEETEGLSELIRKLVRHGLTVCLVEHKMDMIMSLADKIMVLNYGEKIAEGTPAQIRRQSGGDRRLPGERAC